MGEIEQKIKEKLAEIEEKEQVRVIYAAESGSRAWGVESPDSDYDVRFVYVRPLRDYLKLEKQSDVIDWQIDEVWDINGWDIKKVLQQFHGGNATLFEWCGSPVVYKQTTDWIRVMKTAQNYFSEKAAVHHYYGIARNTWEKYLRGNTVKYKKYVYALRPILSVCYIEKYYCMPPVLLRDLMNTVALPGNVMETIERMLLLKTSVNEKALLPQLPVLQDYICTELDRISKTVKQITDDRKEDWEPLNKIFEELLF